MEKKNPKISWFLKNRAQIYCKRHFQIEMFTDEKYFVKNTESNGGFVAGKILTNPLNLIFTMHTVLMTAGCNWSTDYKHGNGKKGGISKTTDVFNSSVVRPESVLKVQAAFQSKRTIFKKKNYAIIIVLILLLDTAGCTVQRKEYLYLSREM